MKNSIPFGGIILTPMQVVRLKFYEREGVSLNAFQTLILEAIEDGYTVDQISKATLLSENVIRAEIDQLASQSLLEKQEEAVTLSELSKNLLLLSCCVRQLNNEPREVCINKVTGSIVEYDKEHFITDNTKKAWYTLELSPKINGPQWDMLSVEDNEDFFDAFLRSNCALEPEQIDTFLSSVDIDLIDTGKTVYRARQITRLPCLIGEEDTESSKESKPSVIARGLLYRIEFSLRSAIPGVDDSLLQQLPELADAGLLSEKGIRLANAVKEYKEVYYDGASGCWQPSLPSFDSSECKVDLDLPPLSFTPDVQEKYEAAVQEWISNELAASICQLTEIPPEFTLEMIQIDKRPYFIAGDLHEVGDAYVKV